MFLLKKILIMVNPPKSFIRTYFGIETNHGLFCLSKNVAVENSKSVCPDELQQDIQIYIPDSNAVTFNKLNNIKKIQQVFASQQINCYKSFYCSENKFERTMAVQMLDVNKNLNKMTKFDGFHNLEFQWNGKCHTSKTVSLDADTTEFFVSKLEHHHPIFDSKECSVVYSDYNQVLLALDTIHKNDTLLDMSEYLKIVHERTLQSKHELQHPFIVVEGLDGTGKSTLCTNLSNYLNAKALSTPPPSIAAIRKKFDHLPEIYRRAYYAFSNYLAAQDVLEITKTKSVVMDRFWHSTTAYAIANEVECGINDYIPPKGHAIYTWPKDLLFPSAVIFLSTPENDRDSRVNEREELTAEEKQLSVNQNFRARIMETYRRIGHTKWIEIDTSGTKEETLEKTVNSLKQNGIC